jgi:hypothetical protein
MVYLNKYGTSNHKSKFTQITNCPKLKNVMNEKVNHIARSRVIKNQKFKIFHQNIYGLQHKSDKLLASLHPDLPDVLCITEHHLNSMQLQLVSLEEYNLATEFCRQSFHKGGVCMFIHKRHSFADINIRDTCKDKELEACAVKLKISTIILCILIIYRSPSGNFRFFLKGLENILKKIYKTEIN